MHFKRAVNDYKQFVWLGLAAFVSVATSFTNMVLRPGDYKVQSDCAGIVSQTGTLSIDKDLISSQAKAFGFPNEQFEQSSSSSTAVKVKNQGGDTLCNAVIVSGNTREQILFRCGNKAATRLDCLIVLDLIKAYDTASLSPTPTPSARLLDDADESELQDEVESEEL